MTLTCPVDLDSLRLRREVQDMYARVAESPDGRITSIAGPPTRRACWVMTPRSSPPCRRR